MQACPEGLTPCCLDWYTSIQFLRSVAGWENAAVVVSVAFTEAWSLEVRIVVKLVVNAEQVWEGRDLEGTFADQLTSADLILLNKTDLVPAAALPEAT